jgi:spermidine/putrescine-binding protein
MLEAENAAALSNYIAYGSPNAAALEFVDPEVVEFYAGTDSANLEVIEDQGDYEINYTDYFAIAKG